MQIARAAYEPNKVILKAWGRQIPMTYELKDGVLTLRAQHGAKTLKKLANVPDELVLKPLTFGKPKELPAEKVQAAQAELVKRLQLDQAVRRDRSRRGEMAKVDADNTAYLKKQVTETGWIDVGRFGRSASHAAFLLVQHSGDLPLMLAALPHIKKDVKAKHFDGPGS